jgi:hypothetical protein
MYSCGARSRPVPRHSLGKPLTKPLVKHEALPQCMCAQHEENGSMLVRTDLSYEFMLRHEPAHQPKAPTDRQTSADEPYAGTVY